HQRGPRPRRAARGFHGNRSRGDGSAGPSEGSVRCPRRAAARAGRAGGRRRRPDRGSAVPGRGGAETGARAAACARPPRRRRRGRPRDRGRAVRPDPARSQVSDSRRGGAFGWKALLGIALSVALLAFALRGVDLHEVLREIGRAQPLWFLAAVFAATAVFLVRAWRWKPLLQPMLPDSPLHPRFAATTIGFMTNNILPVRIGEFARAFALSRMQPIPVAASFGTVAVERLFDGLTIVVFLIISIMLPGFPGAVTVDGVELGGLLRLFMVPFAAAGAALLAMVVWPRQA